MRHTREQPILARETVIRGLALCFLLVTLAWVVAGPSGLLAWGEARQSLEQRQAEIIRLTKARDEWRNRVALLDQRAPDPDLSSELLRKNLNVAHPDEVIMIVR
ncbi:septum formation initiator [Novosphingobium sp. FSY-8]|uniref:Septum formation initiator n=1 Tax=Novosphingobium ovatum TaxID=1908523 RepID=A0ABW9XCD9_9SPHN|nr:septum formation initiator [Novosphingobium ovatum]NBC36214.1 septum formation initiator [Novosphingobium ovatum]